MPRRKRSWSDDRIVSYHDNRMAIVYATRACTCTDCHMDIGHDYMKTYLTHIIDDEVPEQTTLCNITMEKEDEETFIKEETVYETELDTICRDCLRLYSDRIASQRDELMDVIMDYDEELADIDLELSATESGARKDTKKFTVD